MTLFAGLILAVAAMLAMGWLFTRVEARTAAQSTRILLGVLGLLIGLGLTLRGLAVLGVPMLGGALGLLAAALRGGAKPAGSGPSGTGPAGGWQRRQSGPPPGARPQSMSVAEARAVLKIGAGASEAEIKRAYREQMKHAHPDAGGSDEMASRVAEARDVLLETLRN